MTNDIRIQFALLSTALLFLVAGALFQQQVRETPTVLDDLDFSASQARASSPTLTSEIDTTPAPEPTSTPAPAPAAVPPPPAPAETTYQ